MNKRSVLAVFAFSTLTSLGFAQSRPNDLPPTITVQEGTTIRVSLETTLSTKSARVGDRFSASVREPIYVNGKEAIPYGARVDGRVSEVQRPGRTHGVGKIDIAFESIQLPNGYNETIVASTAGVETTDKSKAGKEGTISGPSSKKRDAGEVAAAGGAGAGIGAIAGGAKGTAIGGGAGALIGLADTLRRRGKDLELPAGTTLVMRLDRPLSMQPPTGR